MVRIIFYCLTFFISFSAFSLDKVTASVDKNPAIQGESFILEIIANDDVSRNAFDTSSLLKDFIVGRTSVSSQTNMINGSTTRQTRWSTVLVAKEPGKFIIPKFDIDGKKTAEIAMVILPASEKSQQQTRDIFITSALSSNNVYVQQQFTLTIKLYFAVNLESGSLSDPELLDAEIIKLGQDEQKEEIINGRRFQVIERKFAVTPQKSGELTIEMPIFSGEVSMPSSRRHGLFSFNNSKPVSVVSEPVKINVKAKPQHYQGQWLPSELFSIHQEWQPNDGDFMVGEPITRTVTITAAGLSKEQLPKIQMGNITGLKIYPDQPELHGGINGERLVSQAVMNFAIVASQAGSFNLPEIRIPWWNTVTNKQEYAVLPEQTILIKDNPNLATSVKTPLNNDIKLPTNIQTETIIVESSNWLQWVFLTLWLLTLLLWGVTAQLKHKKAAVKSPITNNNQNYLALIAACKQNKGQEVLKQLLPWLQTLLAPTQVNNLTDAINKLNEPTLTAAINNLQASYYSKDASQWHSDELLKVIQALNKRHASLDKSSSFTLNP